jgi:hypothetical protein
MIHAQTWGSGPTRAAISGRRTPPGATATTTIHDAARTRIIPKDVGYPGISRGEMVQNHHPTSCFTTW